MQQLTTKLLTGILVFCSFYAAEAQNVTKEFRNMPLVNLIKELENQTGYSFIYDKSDFTAEPKVTENFKDAPLKSVLDKVILPPLKYELKGKIVVITRTPEVKQKTPSLL